MDRVLKDLLITGSVYQRRLPVDADGKPVEIGYQKGRFVTHYGYFNPFEMEPERLLQHFIWLIRNNYAGQIDSTDAEYQKMYDEMLRRLTIAQEGNAGNTE